MNRIWTFIISNKLNASQLSELRESGQAFVKSWTAHEHQLFASFEILEERIIIVKVNEDLNNASGCSIDKLTRFIRDSESKFGIELLNRFLVAYKNEKGLEVTHASKIKDLLSKNIITEDTLVYNTAISRESELQNWEQPIKATWLGKYLNGA